MPRISRWLLGFLKICPWDVRQPINKNTGKTWYFFLFYWNWRLYCHVRRVWLNHIILSCAACLAEPYYIVMCGVSGWTILYCHVRRVWLNHIFPPTLSPKRHDFRNNKKKCVLNVKCVFWYSLYILSEIFLILRRIQRDVIMFIGIHAKYPLFLPDFNGTWSMSCFVTLVGSLHMYIFSYVMLTNVIPFCYTLCEICRVWSQETLTFI